MSIPYPDCVECILKSEKEKLTLTIEGRYLLKVKLKNSFTETLTIVMMNPSKANESCSDETVNKVIEFILKKNLCQNSLIKNIGFVNVINIFPLYEPNSAKVKDKLNEIIISDKLDLVQARNKSAFNDAISESQNVVLAWGDIPSGVKAKYHNHEAIMIYNLIVSNGLEGNTYILRYNEFEQLLTNKKRPRHPGRKTLNSFVKINSMKIKRNFLRIDVNDKAIIS